MFCSIRFTTLLGLAFALVLQSSSAFGRELTGELVGTLIDLETDPVALSFHPTGTFHPSKMDISPLDRKIYFNSATTSQTFRVDDSGTLELVATYPAVGFLLGCQFDDMGNLYVVNGVGLWKIAASDLGSPPVTPTVPHFTLPPAPFLPMSVGIDGNHAYVGDMIKGEIWKIDTGTPETGELWADAANDGYPLLGNPNSTNFLNGASPGPGFGVVELMPGPMGNWLYYTNHEGHSLFRIRIQNNGSAGVAQEIDGAFPFAFNGAYLDPVEDRIYIGSPFTNFQNGLAQVPNAVAAGALFYVNNLTGRIELLVQDEDLGVPVDAISGRDFGSGHDDKLYVLDGSFDTLLWPSGDLPDPTKLPGHAAIRIVEFGPDD